MSGKKGENWEQFHDLTEMMENTALMKPSGDLTAKVMARINAETAAKQMPSRRRFLETELTLDFSRYVTKKECAFYFVLTGFFYLVLAAILLLGLRLPAFLLHNSWLSLQPFFGLIISAGLISMGIVIYRDDDISIHFIQAGTVLYTVLIILNGCMGVLLIRIPVAIFFTVMFSVTGLGAAFLLGLAVNNYHPGTMLSEVRK